MANKELLKGHDAYPKVILVAVIPKVHNTLG